MQFDTLRQFCNTVLSHFHEALPTPPNILQNDLFGQTLNNSRYVTIIGDFGFLLHDGIGMLPLRRRAEYICLIHIPYIYSANLIHGAVHYDTTATFIGSQLTFQRGVCAETEVYGRTPPYKYGYNIQTQGEWLGIHRRYSEAEFVIEFLRIGLPAVLCKKHRLHTAVPNDKLGSAASVCKSSHMPTIR